jgi:hypothetical protein
MRGGRAVKLTRELTQAAVTRALAMRDSGAIRTGGGGGAIRTGGGAIRTGGGGGA